MCIEKTLNGFLACTTFLINGLYPLWRIRGGHGEVVGGEPVQHGGTINSSARVAVAQLETNQPRQEHNSRAVVCCLDTVISSGRVGQGDSVGSASNPCEMKGGVFGVPRRTFRLSPKTTSQCTVFVERQSLVRITLFWGLRKEFQSYVPPGPGHGSRTSVEDGTTASRCSNVGPSWIPSPKFSNLVARHKNP